jgi:ABC-type spermidine/putrescine transport system permease subunit II
LRRVCFGAFGAAVLIFLFAPIVLLVLFSFNKNPAGALPITGWTTGWYEAALEEVELQEALFASLEVAAQVAAVSVIVGALVSFPLVRSRLPFRTGVQIWLTLPIMLPGLLVGVSILIMLSSALHVGLSKETAVLGQCLFTTPFAILLISARLRTLDRSLEWAASDLGAAAFARLRYVVLPALAPALVASALLTFALSLDEFVITFWVIGTDQTLPLYIYNHVRYGITPSVNAVAALFLGGTILAMTLALVLPTALRRLRGLRPGSR